MWIAVLGERRHEISLMDAYENYRSRYDTEHLFRFQKNKLLMEAYQTADVEHEERWWQLCLLAYLQLYLAKDIAPILPHPWERYLPEYKNVAQRRVGTPSQTQRGFAKVLAEIGTPAAPCVARGKPCGRVLGEEQEKRPKNPVIFKSKKAVEETKAVIVEDSEKITPNSNLGKISELIKLVEGQLGEMKLSAEKFAKMLLDSS